MLQESLIGTEIPIIPYEKIPSWVIKNGYKIELDQFYTKKVIAKQCLSDFYNTIKKLSINWKEYTFLEPAAGQGIFFDLLPKPKIGLDLESHHPKIIKKNFFDFMPDNHKKYLAIGNPPFGVRSWMALAFINQCSLFCDLVGFILPMYFASDGKGSAKSRVKNMNLVFNVELPSNSFQKYNGEEVSINTVFQIWAKKELSKTCKQELPIAKLKEYVDIFTVCTAPSRRCGLKRMNDYDCFLQSTYYKKPKVEFCFSKIQYGSGYGMIIKKNKNKISQILQEVDWEGYALRATNHCKHLGILSIYKALHDKNILNIE